MAIVLPDEKEGKTVESLISAQGASTTDMGMLASRLDLNTAQKILLNDGTNDRILFGYQAGGF